MISDFDFADLLQESQSDLRYSHSSQYSVLDCLFCDLLNSEQVESCEGLALSAELWIDCSFPNFCGLLVMAG